MSNKSKKVGEIFSDYKTNSNIKYAEVTVLNVVKKTNTLQVGLYFDEYIEIKEIWYFEKFLKERFQFSNIDIPSFAINIYITIFLILPVLFNNLSNNAASITINIYPTFFIIPFAPILLLNFFVYMALKMPVI